MSVDSKALTRLVDAIFSRAGCEADEASTIARHLVEANLVGHDSHGVIRVPAYIDWLEAGKVVANQSIEIVFENESMAVVDGKFGFGQVIGEQAVDLGIEKCSKNGVAIVGLRNAGHVGRVGDWAIRAADVGLFSIHFVNTSGGGILVAPFGGTDRRLSANPIAAGVPVPDRAPIIADFSTCVIAEGKIRVARNKGVPVPENAIIDAQGRPTTSPEEFYADPPGAILTIAEHKGYVLSVIAEVLAGALTGNGCSHPDNESAKRVANGMLSIYVDPERMGGAQFGPEVQRLIEWVTASPPREPGGEILMPGDPEERTKAERLANGIPLDDMTLRQVIETAQKVGVADDIVASVGAGN